MRRLRQKTLTGAYVPWREPLVVFVAEIILNKQDKRRFANLPAVWLFQKEYDDQMRTSPHPFENYEETDLNEV